MDYFHEDSNDTFIDQPIDDDDFIQKNEKRPMKRLSPIRNQSRKRKTVSPILPQLVPLKQMQRLSSRTANEFEWKVTGKAEKCEDCSLSKARQKNLERGKRKGVQYQARDCSSISVQ